MRPYELMYIVRPHLDEEAVKGLIERFQGVIQDHNGQVDQVEKVGKRRLAYEIDDLNEGFYVIMNFQAVREVVDELDRQIGLTESVLRHMIIRDDE